MKKILMATLCCVFAVALAVSGCNKDKGGEKTKSGDKAAGAKAPAGDKAAEKAKPVKSGPEGLGERMCTAFTTGDVDAIFDLMPKEMMEKTAEMMAQFSEEPKGDPIADMKKEMKADMEKQKMESCKVVSSKEVPCNEEMLAGFEQLGLTAPSKCASLTMTAKMAGEDEDTDDMTVIELDGKWYMGGM